MARPEMSASPIGCLALLPDDLALRVLEFVGVADLLVMLASAPAEESLVHAQRLQLPRDARSNTRTHAGGDAAHADPLPAAITADAVTHSAAAAQNNVRTSAEVRAADARRSFEALCVRALMLCEEFTLNASHLASVHLHDVAGTLVRLNAHPHSASSLRQLRSVQLAPRAASRLGLAYRCSPRASFLEGRSVHFGDVDVLLQACSRLSTAGDAPLSIAMPVVKLSSAALRTLSHMCLQSLDISHVSVHRPQTRPVLTQQHPLACSLERLHLLSPALDVAWPLQCLQRLTAFEGCLLRTQHILGLAECPLLTELHLVETRVCDLRAHTHAWRATMRRVTSLTLEACALRPRSHLLQPDHAVLREALDLATCLSSLAVVFPSDIAINAALMDECLPFAHSLQHVRVHTHTSLDDATIASVAIHTGSRLQSLILGPSCSAITDAAMSIVASQCTSLRRLELPYAARVTDDGVRTLLLTGAASTLARLHLTCAGIRSASTLHMIRLHCANLEQLRVLGLHVAAGDLDATTGLRGYDALRIMQARGVHVQYVPRPAADVWTPSALRDDVPKGRRSLCVDGCGAAILHGDEDDHALLCSASATRCINADSGCAWAGRRGELTTHMLRCASWLISCPHRCGQWISRSKYARHVRQHVAASEFAARRPRCPFAGEACFHRALHWEDRDDHAAVQVAWHELTTHIASGECAAASYLCGSCGQPCGRRARASCEAPGCIERGIVRCRMPHILAHEVRIPDAVNAVTA